MMIAYLLWMLLGCGVLFIMVCLWMIIHYWLAPHIDHPDGKARITGSCGDTMEISLKFEGDHVGESAYWTDGCVASLNCICAAAALAKGKTPDEIMEIDPNGIQQAIGGLPADKRHCAQLSVETLHAALEDYMRKKKKGTGFQ